MLRLEDDTQMRKKSRREITLEKALRTLWSGAKTLWSGIKLFPRGMKTLDNIDLQTSRLRVRSELSTSILTIWVNEAVSQTKIEIIWVSITVSTFVPRKTTVIMSAASSADSGKATVRVPPQE